jgi:hypothetical protein
MHRRMPVFSSDLMNSGTFNLVDKPLADFQTAVLFNRYSLPNRPVSCWHLCAVHGPC